MRKYFFVETAAPADAADRRVLRDAARVARRTDSSVSVALVEGAVLAAVVDHPVLAELAGCGAEIGVDSFSLSQWGFADNDVPGYRLVNIEWVLERMLDADSTAVWH